MNTTTNQREFHQFSSFNRSSCFILNKQASYQKNKNQKGNYPPAERYAAPEACFADFPPYIDSGDNPDDNSDKNDIHYKCPDITDKIVVLITADPMEFVNEMVPSEVFVFDQETVLVNKIYYSCCRPKALRIDV
jgi:hypothetical protein